MKRILTVSSARCLSSHIAGASSFRPANIIRKTNPILGSKLPTAYPYRSFASESSKDESKRQEQPHAAPPKTGNFFQNLMSDFEREMKKSKELKENRDRLKQEMDRITNSDELKEARRKFDVISQESLSTTQRIHKQVIAFHEKYSKNLAETEYGKKLSAATEQMLKNAAIAAEQIKKTAEAVGDAPGVKQVAESMKIVQQEINDITLSDARVYKRPDALRSRDYYSMAINREFEPNTEATDVELHRSSKVFESFKSWTQDNAVYNRLLDWKMRFDESESVFARLTRSVTDTVSSAIGGNSDLSDVLTEIAKVDPSFDVNEFSRFCETDIIPNVLEAITRNDIDILKDWLHERAFKVLEQPLMERKKMGYVQESRILDISKVEVAMGKMMEYGPVMVITFSQYVVQALKTPDGKVIEGDPDHPVRMNHVWSLCRDMDVYDPKSAWQVLEMHWIQTGQ